MEVTRGPIAPLSYGHMTRPESWILGVEKGWVESMEGSNSPLLEELFGKGLTMDQVQGLMKLAAEGPCTLEFI